MKHARADDLVVIAELTVREDRINEFFDYTINNLSISRSHPGNIVFDILVDTNKSGHVIFYEVWESEEIQQAYMRSRIQAGDLTRLMSFLAAEPKFTALRRIAGEFDPGS